MPNCAAPKAIALRFSSWLRPDLTNGARTALICATLRPIGAMSSFRSAFGGSRLLRKGSIRKALSCFQELKALSKTEHCYLLKLYAKNGPMTYQLESLLVFQQVG